MLLDQGRIIEFNQYVELPGDIHRPTSLVPKLKLQILFVVQSNRKRGIWDVEKNGWSLDMDKLTKPFVFILLSILKYYKCLHPEALPQTSQWNIGGQTRPDPVQPLGPVVRGPVLKFLAQTLALEGWATVFWPCPWTVYSLPQFMNPLWWCWIFPQPLLQVHP